MQHTSVFQVSLEDILLPPSHGQLLNYHLTLKSRLRLCDRLANSEIQNYLPDGLANNKCITFLDVVKWMSAALEYFCCHPLHFLINQLISTNKTTKCRPCLDVMNPTAKIEYFQSGT